jgi:hypothetical protein
MQTTDGNSKVRFSENQKNKIKMVNSKDIKTIIIVRLG